MVGITYEDFLDTSYEPIDSGLVCTFSVAPAADMDIEAAASRVASESSNGTWARLEVGDGFTDLSATAFDIDGDFVRVAYPDGLFEPGNMAQILSCIAGNIMGMKAVDRIRLVDCEWPETLVSSFPGPGFGRPDRHFRCTRPAADRDGTQAESRPLDRTARSRRLRGVDWRYRPTQGRRKPH